jgi:hypothetical protein
VFIWYIFPVLVSWIQKNLATLARQRQRLSEASVVASKLDWKTWLGFNYVFAGKRAREQGPKQPTFKLFFNLCFQKNQCYDQNFAYFRFVLSQERQFFRWIFWRKHLKIITSVPALT